jgi:hypothetical protein
MKSLETAHFDMSTGIESFPALQLQPQDVLKYRKAAM